MTARAMCPGQQPRPRLMPGALRDLVDGVLGRAVRGAVGATSGPAGATGRLSWRVTVEAFEVGPGRRGHDMRPWIRRYASDPQLET